MTNEQSGKGEPDMLLLAVTVDIQRPNPDGTFPTSLFMVGSVADTQEMVRSLVYGLMGPTCTLDNIDKLSIGLATTQAVVDAIEEFKLAPTDDEAQDDNTAV